MKPLRGTKEQIFLADGMGDLNKFSKVYNFKCDRPSIIIGVAILLYPSTQPGRLNILHHRSSATLVLHPSQVSDLNHIEIDLDRCTSTWSERNDMFIELVSTEGNEKIKVVIDESNVW
ncbi:unnamed protein product [Lactuca saligna]|uniref:Uncharacterized protein n=1 Tax=Lactuca saligna TaxID=75948 RepID=A0AA35ZRZ2_LACSI|nr:unnamed protein product [Lactuca saligna]